jgi:pimeloyl-ACP methyl ester carboxylesterase
VIRSASHVVAFVAGVLLVFAVPAAAGGAEPPTVVLLHGLARTSFSMSRLASSLEAQGYRVCNLSYPSREETVQALAARHVVPAIRSCIGGSGQPVNFVTHSLGGIMVRQLAASDPDIRIGRVVMLGPPNRGSEVVDEIGDLFLFELANGPAGLQLGTGADSLPTLLGAPVFEVGVIAGSRSVNPILSLIIPGVDDGKVSVENARLDGMADFLVIPVSHPFMMRDDRVIEETIHFLKHGFFRHDVGPLGSVDQRGRAGAR